MQGVRRGLGRHEQLVGAPVTVRPIGAAERRHVETRPGPPDDAVAIGRELERRTVDDAVGDLRQADRVGEAELDLAGRRPGPQEPALQMERLTVIRAPAGLPVQQEWLPDVLDDDLLVVGERVDRRVLPSTRSSPRPQEERQRGEVAMHVELHGTEGITRSVRGRKDADQESRSRRSIVRCRSTTLVDRRSNSANRAWSSARRRCTSAASSGATGDGAPIGTEPSSMWAGPRARTSVAGSPRSRACRSQRLERTTWWMGGAFVARIIPGASVERDALIRG